MNKKYCGLNVNYLRVKDRGYRTNASPNDAIDPDTAVAMLYPNFVSRYLGCNILNRSLFINPEASITPPPIFHRLLRPFFYHFQAFLKLNWRATYKLWGNPQLLSTIRDDSLDSTPEIPYSVFFLLRLVKLPIYYCLHTYVIPTVFSETIYAFFLEDVSPVQQTLIRRISDVTAREIVIRSYTAIIWILESLIFLDSANAVLACFFVLIGLDQPSEWPALFGDITTATSLRRFWARFWHRLAVRPYTNYGKVLASTLRLKPGSFAFKMVVACVVFLLSGVTHSAVSWRVGQRKWYLDIWWFFLNFLGCLLEVIFLAVVRRLAKATRWSRDLEMIEESWFGKFIGYAWVFGFFFWSTPKWRYPNIYRQILEVRGWS
ncbi:hypothetical protein DPV78_006641 [Talaromyces pinophilus]|nr:hypothetical protein DPV78_006641 [Talaromyces pinophilus]